MSAEEFTTSGGHTTGASPEGEWRELEGRAGGTAVEGEESTSSQVVSAANDKDRRRPVFSLRARLRVAGALGVVAMASAAMVVVALVGGGPERRPRARSGETHAKGREAGRRRSSRARRAEETGGSPRSRYRRHGHAPPHAGRHAHPRPKTRPPVERSTEAPNQPPAYGAASQTPAPEPSAPMPTPAAPSAPEEGPGLRDGATESTEFGL